jgi:cell wall-associated NlpC family hydrolase
LGVSYDIRPDSAWDDLTRKPTSFDGATFVCRVAAETLGSQSDRLVPDARWLIDILVEATTPEPGDVVGYSRAATGDEVVGGQERLWHVMLYAGNGMVIGACDARRAVVVRPFDYKPVLGTRRWQFVGVRTLQVRD